MKDNRISKHTLCAGLEESKQDFGRSTRKPIKKGYVVLIDPGRKKGMITDDTAKSWIEPMSKRNEATYNRNKTSGKA